MTIDKESRTDVARMVREYGNRVGIYKACHEIGIPYITFWRWETGFCSPRLAQYMRIKEFFDSQDVGK